MLENGSACISSGPCMYCARVGVKHSESIEIQIQLLSKAQNTKYKYKYFLNENSLNTSTVECQLSRLQLS